MLLRMPPAGDKMKTAIFSFASGVIATSLAVFFASPGGHLFFAGTVTAAVVLCGLFVALRGRTLEILLRAAAAALAAQPAPRRRSVSQVNAADARMEMRPTE